MRRRKILPAMLLVLMVGVAGELFAIENAAIVRGRVSSGDKPLPAVFVSDGYRIVRTNSNGEYDLPIGPKSGRFVFVVTPRGYWTEAFYVLVHEAVASGRADFALSPKGQPDRFDFVFACDLADLSAGPGKVGKPKTKASIREINSLDPTPAFLMLQGDISIRSNNGKDCVECFSVSKVPTRIGIGNHEIMRKQREVRSLFWMFSIRGFAQREKGPDSAFLRAHSCSRQLQRVSLILRASRALAQ